MKELSLIVACVGIISAATYGHNHHFQEGKMKQAPQKAAVKTEQQIAQPAVAPRTMKPSVTPAPQMQGPSSSTEVKQTAPKSTATPASVKAATQGAAAPGTMQANPASMPKNK